jgi:hypothetical protein
MKREHPCRKEGPSVPNRKLLPFCRSPFLQDVTIALGLGSLKSLRKRRLLFDVSSKEYDGKVHEALEMEAQSIIGNMVHITLWEDGIAWLHSAHRPANRPPQNVLETHSDFSEYLPEAIAAVLRATLTDPNSAWHFWKEKALPKSL